MAVIVTMAATSDALAAALELFLVTPGGLRRLGKLLRRADGMLIAGFVVQRVGDERTGALLASFDTAGKPRNSLARWRLSAARRIVVGDYNKREFTMLQASESLSPRRSIAAELARIYGELAGTEAKPAPRFSLAEVFRQMVDGGGLHRG